MSKVLRQVKKEIAHLEHTKAFHTPEGVYPVKMITIETVYKNIVLLSTTFAEDDTRRWRHYERYQEKYNRLDFEAVKKRFENEKKEARQAARKAEAKREADIQAFKDTWGGEYEGDFE